MIELDSVKDEVKITFGSCYGIYSKRSDIFKTIAAE